MKAFGIIFLAVLVAFVGYQFGYPKLDEMLDLNKPTMSVVEITPSNEKSTVEKIDTPSVETKMEPRRTGPSALPEKRKSSDPSGMPSVAATGGADDLPKKEVGPDEFLPTTFPPLEEVVKGWSEIPKKVFPRQVKLLKDVEFKMSVGSSRVKAGGNAMALGQEGENLIVAPTENSPAHSQILLTDTDLKETLAQAYDTWKVKMAEWQRRQWEYKKTAAANPQNVVKTNPQATTRSDKPKRNPDGTYDILLTSMKTGQVNEITPSNIKKWGEAQITSISGREYFTVVVNYTTKTMFGDFDTEAQARIMNGRVEKWVYTGSGEVVP